MLSRFEFIARAVVGWALGTKHTRVSIDTMMCTSLLSSGSNLVESSLTRDTELLIIRISGRSKGRRCRNMIAAIDDRIDLMNRHTSLIFCALRNQPSGN